MGDYRDSVTCDAEPGTFAAQAEQEAGLCSFFLCCGTNHCQLVGVEHHFFLTVSGPEVEADLAEHHIQRFPGQYQCCHL
jgi:hypothetical protein